MLSPVRTELERQNMPISIMLPNDANPSPFRIRENADLLQALKQAAKGFNSASDWLNYLTDKYPSDNKNTWARQLQTLLSDWQRETADSEVSNRQTLEYLCENLAEQRKERLLGNGIMLSTIHAVKGMEFSHVFILDGGWNKQDLEEQRRLLYVAMTRAKETLCLMKRQDWLNPFLREIQGECLMIRAAPETPTTSPNLNSVYQILGLQEMDLGFAGSFEQHHAIHQQLALLMPGQPVTMVKQNGNLILQSNGIGIARIAKATQTVWLNKLEQIERIVVIAMLKRSREDGNIEYQSRSKVDVWEVPLVEVLYIDSDPRHVTGK